ncbi:MAG: bifunctional (p)ppGpp synthetase/guanosine-3',5'-bis(diphosphate) 3'-pyrophosphohydrolase [Deltaproteobacteria bacterium]|nr:bifunctional (p)ppGpp synthetase/guanosine-3',5'-bis(diphosphate) 3'-pyrophosphohydrolase [Deltaproteobacteria bacterium]
MAQVRLTDILDKVRSYHPDADVDLINRAYVYAARMHEGQTRKSGEPYFVHPVSVAGIIAELRLDTASICAALLHDVVEDTSVSQEEIAKAFGDEVAFLVDGVTKLGKINFASKEDRQAESFRKMLLAMARDIRVLLVKLADRLDNMRTLQHMKEDSRERIAQETLEIYAPLANRLGINWIKAELEDLALRWLHPEQFFALKEKVNKSEKERQKYITDVVRTLERIMAEHGFSAEIAGRPKHLYSIFRKMQKSQCEYEQVYDVIAFRIIVETTADCYAVLGVVHSRWTPIPGRFKDYVALPKPNMYQSLHTTVIGPKRERIEVQIRTKEMNSVAENGIAAHWKYKEQTGGLDAKDAERFHWLRQLVDFHRDMKDPTEFIESVKVDLFQDEVYVFTPKGEVRVFPRGATPIDFAYAIHSDVGAHCSGARVNGSIVPLKYQLHNGDTVEILTSTNQEPSKDWLDIAVTSRAKSKIRNHVRQEERDRSLELGRDMLERELHKRDVSLGRLQKTGGIDKILEKLKIRQSDELFALIGYGKLTATEVAEIVVPSAQPAPDELRPGLVERAVRKVSGKGDGGIRIGGLDDVLVRFGKCCNPLPGDEITGWITRGRGVTVHRRTCPRALEQDPERRIDVSWDGSTKINRPVTLKVLTSDRPGILANVSTAFTQNGVNIAEANCRSTDDGRACNLFTFTIGDLGKLRTVIRAVSKVAGVYSVDRV